MNDEWETPGDLYGVLDNEFHFEVDAAANDYNFKHPNFLHKNSYLGGEGSLTTNWSVILEKNRKSVWLNPPYSRGNIDKFMKKAYEESLNGCTVVCLVRDDPSTEWYRNWVDGKAAEVRRMARRIKFVGADNCYNFPTCIVVYKPNPDRYEIDTEYYLWDWR